jgi:hypothetical protein
MPQLSIVIPTLDQEFDLPAAIEAGLAGVRAARRAGFDADLLVADAGSRDGSVPLLRQLEALYCDAGLRVFVGPVDALFAMTPARHLLLAPVDHVLVGDNAPLLLRSALDTRAAIVYGNVIHADGAVSGNESIQPRVFREDYLPRVLLLDTEQVADADVRTALRQGRRVVFVPLVTAFAPARQEVPPAPVDEPLRDRWPLASKHLRYFPGVGPG